MAKFTSIDCALPIRQDRCVLSSLEWSSSSLIAVWTTEKFPVKVTLNEVLGLRTLDEMIYSIYGEKVEGVTPDGFAYTVEGSTVFPNLFDLSLHGWRNLHHYAFISLNTCLNVLSNQAPIFETLGDSTIAARDVG